MVVIAVVVLLAVGVAAALAVVVVLDLPSVECSFPKTSSESSGTAPTVS